MLRFLDVCRFPRWNGRRIAILAAAALALTWGGLSAADAKVIYVDNRIGDDKNDGSGTETVDSGTGPIRSLARAHVLVRPGDRIEIINTGTVYHGSLSLIGSRCSGTTDTPVIVEGNGAVIDGSMPVSPDDWQPLGRELWRLVPKQKTHYQLVLDETAVPYADVPPQRVGALDLGPPNPPAGHWTVWRGAIYYHVLPDEIPFLEPYRLAGEEAGIFLYHVHHVIVQNLTVRHFRLDGVNAHDQVYRTLLRNVTSEANARSGLFIGGSSRLQLLECTLQNNREASLLIRELGQANVENSQLDTDPVLRD